MLSKVDDWQFDTFALERATNGRPLSALAFALFQRSELNTRFGIHEGKLVRCGHPLIQDRTLRPFVLCTLLVVI